MRVSAAAGGWFAAAGALRLLGEKGFKLGRLRKKIKTVLYGKTDERVCSKLKDERYNEREKLLRWCNHFFAVL